MIMKNELLDRSLAPGEELRHLIELGYASRRKADREIAGVVDTWLSKQPFVISALREAHYGR
jgi:hypothetical protein